MSAGAVGVFIVLGLGVWWLAISRRYLFRGSSASIRTALPVGAWRDVQQQLNGKRRVDPAIADVVLAEGVNLFETRVVVR